MKPDHDDVAADAASDAKPDPQAKADPEAKADPQAKADPVTAAGVEAAPEAKTQVPAKAETQAPAEAETQAPAKSASPPESEAETEAEPEAKTEAAPKPDTAAQAAPAAAKTETVDALTGKPVAESESAPSADTATDGGHARVSDESADGGAADGGADHGGADHGESADDESPGSPSGAGSGGGMGGLFPPKTTKARILVAALVVVLIGLATGGFLWYRSSSYSLPSGTAFRVNGVNVSERDVDDQIQTLGALYGVQPPPDGPRLDTFHRDVAKSFVVAMVIDNAAAERKIAVADRQASDFLSKYVATQYGDGQAGRDAFVKDLADKGTSEPKVLAEVKRQMTLKALYEQVTSDITVSDADVRQTFDQRKAEFATPERREIHNVVLKTKEEADAVAAQAKAGASIETLAQQQSIDESSKASGGNLGLVSAAELQKAYADAAFSTPVGGIFGPVETQKSQGTVYNVGKVVQAQPGAPADFDKIKDGVRQLVISERASTRWHDFLEGKLKDADVVYADKYRPADPDTIPTNPAGPDNTPGQPAQPAPAPNTPPK